MLRRVGRHGVVRDCEIISRDGQRCLTGAIQTGRRSYRAARERAYNQYDDWSFVRRLRAAWEQRSRRCDVHEILLHPSPPAEEFSAGRGADGKFT